MIFKKNKKYLLHRFLASHIFILLIAVGQNLTYTNILPIWFITVVFPNLILCSLKNLKAIEIKNNHIKLVFNKYFYKEETEFYEYTNLRFTYRNEYEASSLSMKFRIYKKNSNKSIISIGGILDGWDEKQIEGIIKELEK